MHTDIHEALADMNKGAHTMVKALNRLKGTKVITAEKAEHAKVAVLEIAAACGTTATLNASAKEQERAQAAGKQKLEIEKGWKVE